MTDTTTPPAISPSITEDDAAYVRQALFHAASEGHRVTGLATALIDELKTLRGASASRNIARNVEAIYMAARETISSEGSR